MGRPETLVLSALAVVLCVCTAAPYGNAAAPPDRFEVLQAAFHPLSSTEATRQGLDERCVLLEQLVGGESAANADARAAADALVNNSSRSALAYAEFAAPHTRFKEYYRTELAPTAYFDGLGLVSGGGPQARAQFQTALDEAARVLPGASINLSTVVVVSTGHIDYEVFSPLNLQGFTVSVRGLIVEDPVSSAEAGGDVRFVVRQYLAGDRLDLTGDSSRGGRLNFSLEPGWVQSRLAAIVFVQVDAPPAGRLPQESGSNNFFAEVLVPLAALAAAGALALIFARTLAAQRRSRRP